MVLCGLGRHVGWEVDVVLLEYVWLWRCVLERDCSGAGGRGEGEEVKLESSKKKECIVTSKSRCRYVCRVHDAF